MEVTIERRGELITTYVTPRKNPPAGQGRVGILMQQENVSIVQADAVQPGSAAETAGIQAGDEFVSVNGRPIEDFFTLEHELSRFSGSSVDVVVRRGDALYTTTVAVPNLGQRQDVFAAIGLPTLRAIPQFESIPLTEIVPRGFSESFHATKLMIQQVKTLFTDRQALKQVAGPVGMGQITSELIRESPLPVWFILAQLSIILSLNLAVLNLLPLPALDGGRLFFVLIEVLRGGRKIASEKEGIVHFRGAGPADRSHVRDRLPGCRSHPRRSFVLSVASHTRVRGEYHSRCSSHLVARLAFCERRRRQDRRREPDRRPVDDHRRHPRSEGHPRADREAGRGRLRSRPRGRAGPQGRGRGCRTSCRISPIPVIADIHFEHTLALRALEGRHPRPAPQSRQHPQAGGRARGRHEGQGARRPDPDRRQLRLRPAVHATSSSTR